MKTERVRACRRACFTWTRADKAGSIPDWTRVLRHSTVPCRPKFGIWKHLAMALPNVPLSVFYLDARGQSWINTGLDARLETFYGAMQTEVRYMETFSDGSA